MKSAIWTTISSAVCAQVINREHVVADIRLPDLSTLMTLNDTQTVLLPCHLIGVVVLLYRDTNDHH
jgi:hypothetical protein